MVAGTRSTRTTEFMLSDLGSMVGLRYPPGP
jgi:hypothetical protein